MKKYKIIGGVLVGWVALNVGIGVYFNIPRHIQDIVAEDSENLSIHEVLTEAFERGFDDRFGPVM